MKLPDIPTDNLYKFEATAFLTAAIIFYATIIFLLVFYTNNQIDYLYTEKAKISIDDSITAIKTKDIIAQINLLDSNKIYNHLSLNSDSINDKEKLTEKYNLLKQEKYDLIIRKTINDYLIESFDDKFKAVIGVSIVLLILFILTILGARNGFKKWSTKLQLYQDAIIMKEAGVSEQEIRKYLNKIEEDNIKEIDKHFKNKKNEKSF